MKLIAVSQRVDAATDYAEQRDALDQRMSTFLLASGYLPIPVPNNLQTAVTSSKINALSSWLDTIRPAGIILSGGNDIGAYPERDGTELQLLEYASVQCLPLLGICRGMQMLAHWAGTALMPVSGHVGSRHSVSGKIAGETNSFHRLALTSCPPCFEILACCADGTIEAIRHTSLPWEGWMWHPERESPLIRLDILRMKALLK